MRRLLNPLTVFGLVVLLVALAVAATGCSALGQDTATGTQGDKYVPTVSITIAPIQAGNDALENWADASGQAKEEKRDTSGQAHGESSAEGTVTPPEELTPAFMPGAP